MRALSTSTAAVALAAAMVAGAPLTASAQSFPERPVTYIIPFNPGGESDITARFQQAYFEALAGHDLVIQYQPGAGGAQAWATLNGLDSDGHTIMGTNLPHIVMQPMIQEPGYATEDIANIYFFHYTPDALLVLADSEFETLEDVVAFAGSNPGRVTVAGTGTNSANHIAQQTFDGLAEVVTAYIPFSGTGASTTALLGGQVMAQWGYTTVAAAQGEQVRMLAVAMEERHPAFPDVPTFRELGYDLVSGAYRGIATPADTPEPVRRQLSDLIDQINQDPAFVQQMEEAGFAVIDVDIDEVDAFMAERIAAYTAVARDMGLIE